MTSPNDVMDGNLPALVIPKIMTRKRPTTCAGLLWDFSQEESVPALVPHKRKQSASSVNVDYFAPIQKVLDNQKITLQLLSDNSKSKSDHLNNITKETSLKKKKKPKASKNILFC